MRHVDTFLLAFAVAAQMVAALAAWQGGRYRGRDAPEPTRRALDLSGRGLRCKEAPPTGALWALRVCDAVGMWHGVNQALPGPAVRVRVRAWRGGEDDRARDSGGLPWIGSRPD
ncbi:hypothetical protein Vqi01_17280 [Micromonospora qiuiae]|uniref:Pilus assembly protein TadE n=1 Tax=Micromonospora qiuiae TaxID=502268 RepID=A0ABQ4J8R3_9ACTN|nr:hypothetical protein Vqi01_17280 [Micromonospora qiuiae]